MTFLAVSILVTAAHAVVPLAPRREAWLAAGFGLVHGLGFATALTALGFHGGTLVLSVLGFNLGIEGMQLVVVALVAPWLLLVRGRPGYSGLRVVCASVAFVAASGWLVERTTGNANPISRALSAAVPHAWVVIALLALSTVLTRLAPRVVARASA